MAQEAFGDPSPGVAAADRRDLLGRLRDGFAVVLAVYMVAGLAALVRRKTALVSTFRALEQVVQAAQSA